MSAPVVWADLIQSDEGDDTIDVLRDRLRKFVFVDRDTKKDIAELHLRNRDQEMFDYPPFRKGQKLLIAWGWDDDIGIPRRMIVKKTKGSDPVVVHLEDESILLDKRAEHRAWHNMLDSDVVLEVAAFNGYEGILVDITPTQATRRNITQATSDARFVQQLARRNGYIWYVDSAGFHFHPRRFDADPTYYYQFLGAPGLGEVLTVPVFDGDPNAVALVKVKARDPITKEPVEATYGISDDLDPAEYATGGSMVAYTDHVISLGNEAELGDPENPDGLRQARVAKIVQVNMGYATQEEVNSEAVRHYWKKTEKSYKMSVSVLGNPLVGAKQLHYWKMPSEVVNGLYYCKEAKTTIIGGSYRIENQYIRDAQGKLFAKKIRPVAHKKNKKGEKEWPLDENGVPVDKEKLDKVETIGGNENGQYVAKWAYFEKGSSTQVGKSEGMTQQEYSGLSPAQRQRLNKAASSAALPGE